MACEMLTVDQPPCMLKPHNFTDRSHTTPPNRSPDTWMDDTKRSTKNEYKDLPQITPQLNDPMMTIAYRMIRKNQPSWLLQPHSYSTLHHIYPHHNKPNHTNTHNIPQNHTTLFKITLSPTLTNTLKG